MQHKIIGQSTLNGSLQKGNYIWGGAMNLAWNELCRIHNNAPIDLDVKDQHAKKMVDNFNDGPFQTKDLSSQSFYVKSGSGPETLKKINTEVKKKFPNKSFPDLQFKLQKTDIISYAYFIKEVQYLVPFTIEQEFHFNPSNAYVRGFKAKTPEQRKNIELIEYKSDLDFIVRLKLKQLEQELYLIKGSRNRLPQDIVSRLKGEFKVQKMTKDDKFGMPVVDLDITRQYEELKGVIVKSGEPKVSKDNKVVMPLDIIGKSQNKEMQGGIISVMMEKIKFRIDQVGAKVENEAAIVRTKCKVTQTPAQKSHL